MGLLYLDATRNWSDPASTDLLYLREDRVWAKPDTDHRFLDATNGYSVPELGPNISGKSWSEVIALANLAAKDPASYQDYIGLEKTLTIDGNTVTARIVEVGRQPLQNGGVGGFVFNPYKGMARHVMNTYNTSSGGYPACEMKTYLEGLAFESEVAAGLQVMKIGCRPSSSSSATTVYTKFALMAHVNVFSGNESSTSARYVFSDEGFRYTYFVQNDTNAARIHYDDSGTANIAWLLTPSSNNPYFRYVNSNGAPDGSTASNSYVPAARFCLGSSI